MPTTEAKPDWTERKTAELLAAARRSGFFESAMRSAKEFHEDGYVWDVALAMSCAYWCYDPRVAK